MIDVLARLCDVADGQFGFFTFAQAAARNVPEPQVRQLFSAGLAESVCPGVARLRAGGRHPFPRLYATWLLLQPQELAWQRHVPAAGVVSGVSALRVHRVGDLPCPNIQVTAPDPTLLTLPPQVVVQQAPLSRDDWMQVAGLPVTRPGRTLADIADSPSADFGDLARLAAAFLRTGVADERELAAGLESYRARHGLAGNGLAYLNSLLAAANQSPSSA